MPSIFHNFNFNGQIYPENHAVMSIHNRGFKYGDGLFESMRLMAGKINFIDLHADRIRKGMKLLKIEGYSHIDEYFIKEKVDELVKRNRIGQNGRIRLTVFRDGEGLYSPTSNKYGYALEVLKIEERRYAYNNQGLIVGVYDTIPKPVNLLSNLKTCNSIPFVMAGIYKTTNSLDEVLLLNQDGFLCESMSCNLFVVYDNKLYTPALSEGCIEGVMRNVVIRIAKENNLPLIEAQINPMILNEAQEVFLTNASRGIQWVMGYGIKRYFNEMSKFLSAKLNELKSYTS